MTRRIPVATLLVAMLAVPAATQSDTCAGATPISNGLTSGTTIGATTDPVTGSCGSMGNEVWYSYQATCTGIATASLCAPGASADYDTAIAAFSGTCGALTQLACNDDSCGTLSSVSFFVTSGQTYLIAVGGFSGATGNFTIDVTCPTAPANDDCATALPIGNGVTAGSNLGATTSAQLGGCATIGSDVWYSYVAPCTGLVLVTTCSGGGSADYDTTLTAFAGACGALSEVACNDDTCSLQSEISFPATAGQTFFISVGGYAGAGAPLQGNFSLDVTCTPAPTNDVCATAIPIGDGQVVASNASASTDAVTGSCGSMGTEVWFAYTATCSGFATASTCAGASFDTAVAVFDGACGALNEVGCNDDACGLMSEVVFQTTAGQTYLIAVGGFSGASGTFRLDMTCTPPPQNWAFRADVPNGLVGAAASRAGDSIVVSHGDSGALAATPYVYDLATGSWASGTAAALARADLAAAGVGGLHYAAGGQDGANVLAALEIYDPLADSWSNGGSMAVARAGLGLVELNGKLHAIGGRNAVAPRSGTPLAAHEVYDPQLDAWSPLASLPTAVADVQATVVLGGRIHVFGGWNGAAPTTLVQVYDPLSDSWSSAAPMPTARDNALAGSLVQGEYAGRGVVIGGFGAAGSALATVEVYDAATNTWTAGSPKPQAAARMAATGTGACGAIHALGGVPAAANSVHEAFVAEESLLLDDCLLDVSAGGQRRFALAAGGANAGNVFLLVGSVSGLGGFPIDSVVLPLTIDSFSFFTLNNANQPPYGNSLGVLTPTGSAETTLTLPPSSNPNLAGLTIWHASVVFDPLAGFNAVFASNATPLALLP